MVESLGLLIEEFQSVVLRTNYCPNPACKHDATGWGGNDTFARITGITGMVRTTGINFTGNGFSRTPTGACLPGEIFTVSFYIQNNTGIDHAGGRQVFVGYTREGEGDAFPENFNTIALGPNGNVIRGSFTTAAAPANATGIYLIIDALNGTVGAGFNITGVLYEKVGTLGVYIDGDSTGGTWLGADGNSESTAP